MEGVVADRVCAFLRRLKMRTGIVPNRPRTGTGGASRRSGLTVLAPGSAAMALLMSLILVVGAVPRASAAGMDTSKLFWLPRQQATNVGWPGYVHPSVATYHNHSYIL